MAVYGPIQIVPPGLLGALNLKNVGRNPSELNSMIQPTLDLQEWLLVQNQESLFASRPMVNGDISTFFPMTAGDSMTIPDNEYWYVWNHTVTMGLGAADFNAGVLAAVAEVQGSIIGYCMHGNTAGPITAGATAKQMVAGGMPRRWFGPGNRFGFGAGAVTVGGAVTATCSIQITRLPF